MQKKLLTKQISTANLGIKSDKNDIINVHLKKKMRKTQNSKVSAKRQTKLNYSRNQILATVLSKTFNYSNERIVKLQSIFMKNGKKNKSHSIIFKLLVLIKEKLPKIESSNNTLDLALSLIEPAFYLKKIKKGGRSFLVPMHCRLKKKIFLGIKYFLEAVSLRRKALRCPLEYAMFLEVSDILSKKQCVSMNKKKELLKQVFRLKGTIALLKSI